MNIQNKIQEVYTLYQSWKIKEALDLNNQILSEDPNNAYAKKYASLLSLKYNPSSNKEIPKVKWKQLKCPHCVSKISYSALTEDQQDNIKWWNYNNLEIKCPYCHTSFVLQKKKANSIIWIKIWNIAKIDWIEYRAVWYVEYEWTWHEWWYRGTLYYIEWILLWKNNNYKYFSEWYFIDDSWKHYEFELSEKFIPKTRINTNSYKELNRLKVKSVYWENSKSYTIGEKIEILDFWDYVLEKEWSWRQKEAWFYKWNKISKTLWLKLFWKEWSSCDLWWISWIDFWNINKEMLIWIWVVVFIFPYILALLVPYFIYLFISKNKSDEWIWIFWKALIFWLIIWPIIWFMTYWVVNSSTIKKPVKITNIDLNKNYELNFNKNDYSRPITTSTKRYDYGWVRTYYKQNIWINFYVDSEEEQNLLKKINIIWKTWNDSNLTKISNWVINREDRILDF